jgi:hypothetical protein
MIALFVLSCGYIIYTRRAISFIKRTVLLEV